MRVFLGVSLLYIVWLYGTPQPSLTKQEVDTMVSFLKSTPHPLSKTYMALKSPFVTPSNPIVVQQEMFSLQAIINQKAYINGRWVGVGDSVLDYKISSIERQKVILMHGDKKHVVYFKRSRNIFWERP
jgi:hypothetical protein